MTRDPLEDRLRIKLALSEWRCLHGLATGQCDRCSIYDFLPDPAVLAAEARAYVREVLAPDVIAAVWYETRYQADRFGDAGVLVRRNYLRCARAIVALLPERERAPEK